MPLLSAGTSAELIGRCFGPWPTQVLPHHWERHSSRTTERSQWVWYCSWRHLFSTGLIICAPGLTGWCPNHLSNCSYSPAAPSNTTIPSWLCYLHAGCQHSIRNYFSSSFWLSWLSVEGTKISGSSAFIRMISSENYYFFWGWRDCKHPDLQLVYHSNPAALHFK